MVLPLCVPYYEDTLRHKLSATIYRFAKYYNVGGEERRKVYKAYGILFKIEVSGTVSACCVPCVVLTPYAL